MITSVPEVARYTRVHIGYYILQKIMHDIQQTFVPGVPDIETFYCIMFMQKLISNYHK